MVNLERRAEYTTRGCIEMYLSQRRLAEALTLTLRKYAVKWRIAMVLSPKLLNKDVIIIPTTKQNRYNTASFGVIKVGGLRRRIYHYTF